MKLLIGMATYNEALNIGPLVEDISSYLDGQDILILDDNSPDGTGQLADKMSRNRSRLKVIHRNEKLGLGSAHIALMNYAISNNYDQLITMDADFSHHPKYLPQIVEELKSYDFVIGSRYCSGGKCNYGIYRRLISTTANILARLMAGITLRECTTAYRGYRCKMLKELPLKEIKSNGYSFFVESLFYITNYKKKMTEFPITFYDRFKGKSKINKIEILKSILMLWRLLFIRLLKRTGKK